MDWKTQSKTEPLFGDVLWNRPVNKARAGKAVFIIASVQQNVLAINQTFKIAHQGGVGASRIVLPESAKKLLQVENDEFIYTDETPSQSLSKTTREELDTFAQWADIVSLVHDPGKNTETLSLLEGFIIKQNKPLVVTSESIQYLSTSYFQILNFQPTLLIATPRDLQKIIAELDLPFALKQRGAITHYIEVARKLIDHFDDLTLQILREDTILTISAQGANVTQVENQQPLHVAGSLATVIWLHNLNKSLQAATTAAYLAVDADVIRRIEEKYQ